METSKLRELVRYESETGKLFWLKYRCGSAQAGQEIICVNKDGYIQVVVGGEFFYGHLLAWQLHYGSKPEFEVDHRNGIRSDNRIDNLREATSSQNSMNSAMRKDNKSGVKGVSWHKKYRKWTARINANNKVAYREYFDRLEDAEVAIKAARERLHKSFSNHGSAQ